MTVNYNGQTFMSDNDLDVNILGPYPMTEITNRKLRKKFKEEFGRTFLGADGIVSFVQKLVSSEVDFESGLFEEILKASEDPEKTLREIVFDKTATGIGRGHSMGGLAGVVLGVNGTKMIDSGLTGLVMSRSLVTSMRRREITSEEIVIPERLLMRLDLVDEYLEISRGVFNIANDFKDKFGGVETFNKVTPYNNPANLLIVLPLDTLATLYFEVKDDNEGPNDRFLPRELYSLVNKLPEITREAGIDVMFKQRVNVPRDTYLHYSVFKNPSLPNYALECAKEMGMLLTPVVRDSKIDFTDGFMEYLEECINVFENVRKSSDPEKIADGAIKAMQVLSRFTNEYISAVRFDIVDSLSWRVWSEQKRHATLKQDVESVYSAAKRSLEIIKPLWSRIKEAHENNYLGDISDLIKEMEKAIIIDDRLKEKTELVLPYLYHSARQLIFYEKLLINGFEERDALYIVPKNIRVRVSEHYDLKNLISLELPLRLCSTCEPERKASSWKKREAILQMVPNLGRLDYFLQPKCRVGYCTEGKHCERIISLRNYSPELHKQVKEIMLNRSR